MFEEFHGTDRFRIIRKIGAGGMGVVYEAHDLQRDMRVALKTLRELDPTALYRLKHEFRSLVDVNHPNLVALYELVSTAKGWFFTMEIVEGVEFLQWVHPNNVAEADSDTDQQTSVFTDAHADPDHQTVVEVDAARKGTAQQTAATALTMQTGVVKGLSLMRSIPPTAVGPAPNYFKLREALMQLADGIHALHAAGKLHRDIKPSNVLVANDGRVVLLDFGLSTGFDPRESDTTFGGKIVGTAAYLAPELCAGKTPTTRSDWYSVGVMLYQALVGSLPFSGAPGTVLADKRRMDPPCPRSLRPGVPRDLDELCVALLNRRPELRPQGSDVLRLLSRGGRLSGVPAPAAQVTARIEPGGLVGRNDHLGTLSRAFDTACAGQGVIVYIKGSSGMGKTALVQYFLDGLIEVHHATVLRGRAYEQESVPYKAFDSVVDVLSRQLLRLTPSEQEWVVADDAWALAQVFPVLARVPIVRDAPAVAHDAAMPAQLRRRAFVALRTALNRLAQLRKVVLCIDDLQWGDADSAELFIELMRAPDTPPLLLIACYRTEDATSSPMLRSLLVPGKLKGVDVREIVVGPLRYADALELAASLIDQQAVKMSPEQVPAIAFEARGSPFLVTELARWASGPKGRADSWSEHGPSDPIVTLEAVLEDRLSQLPEVAESLLEVIAIADRPIEITIAAQAAGVADRVHEIAATLRAGRLIRMNRADSRELAEPYDNRIRQAVVGSIDVRHVRELHLAVARALEGSEQPEPEVMTVHLLAAGQSHQAATYAQKAAQRAAHALAFEHASRLFQLALEHRDPSAPGLGGVYVQLGEALVQAGRGADAARAFLRACQCPDTACDRLTLMRRAADQLLRTGNIDEGLRAVDEVVEAIGMPRPMLPRAQMRGLVIARVWLRLRGLRLRESSNPAPHDLDRIDAMWTAATGLAVVEPITAAYYHSRCLLRALRVGDPFRVARSLCLEAVVVASQGPALAARSRRALEQAREIGQGIGSLEAMGMSAVSAGAAAFLQGQWKGAQEWAERAETILGQLCTGTTWEQVVAALMGSLAAWLLGDLKRACERIEILQADADARADILASCGCRLGYANATWLVRDDVEGAKRALDEARSRWPNATFDVAALGGLIAEINLLLYARRAPAALTLIESRWSDVQQSMMMRVRLLQVEALALRARCLIAAAFPRSDRVLLIAADKIASSLVSQSMLWSKAIGLSLRAAAADGLGDTPKATALLGRAEDEFVGAGMLLHACVVRRRLGQLVSGLAGHKLVADSEQWMASQGVRAPDKLSEMILPGRSPSR